MSVAGELLAEAQGAAAGGLMRSAHRNAYLAALNAARALIVAATGQSPRTHSGTRAELSRVAHADPRIDRAFTKFLADGFELKSWADYGETPAHRLTTRDARQMVEAATQLVANAEAVLSA